MDRPHTDRRFEIELRELETRVLAMAERCGALVSDAVDALLAGDAAAAQAVIARDADVNADELDLDDRAVRLLALQQPVARDLRTIVAALKIVVDLERIADEAVELAAFVPRLSHPELRPVIARIVPAMSGEVTQMLGRCREAFRDRDAALAQGVMATDTKLEALEDELVRHAAEHVAVHPDDVDAALALVGCAKYLGRIADHCTNVAEMVVYAVEGRGVGHRAPRESSGGAAS
ncbi:MAG TPA: phosphate signaling complex protein PhoU [Sandaracinaceae bacterium LLY-WYZ-13_1]|nr:phosphate signaling complex protein PhoU [Sandaracinaceae bacterium LLY-WYZ-13_1]